MNQENAYSKGCKEKYLLKSKTGVDLVEFNFPGQFQKHLMLQPREGVFSLFFQLFLPECGY